MEKEKDDLISVIIPVHNGQNYISACVASILAQQVRMEIIIVNDGSTDQTAEICEALRKRHDGLRIITMADLGVSCARNAGLSIAAGNYLTFVDADDRLLPGMLQRLRELAVRTGSDIVGCGFALWYGEADFARLTAEGNHSASETEIDRKSAVSQTQTTPAEISYTGSQFIDKGILNRDTRCWSKLYRKAAIAGLTFEEDLSIGEDMLFLLTAAGMANKIAITDFKGYAYFQNPHGAMNRVFRESYMDQITCWQRAAERIGKLRPDLHYRAVGNVMIAILLTVGKIAELPPEQRRQHEGRLKFCREQLKAARETPLAFAGLDRGYQIKAAFFAHFPGLYVKAYHRWKKRYLHT